MPFITTAVDGGLDLVTPPVSVVPGRLQDNSNFEVALNQGVKSIDGFERFDGGVSPSAGSFNGWSVALTGNTTGVGHLVSLTFVGGRIEFNCVNTRTGATFNLICPVVYSRGLTSTTGLIYFTTSNKTDSAILSDILNSGPLGYEFLNNNPAAYSQDGLEAAIFVQGAITASSQLATVADNLAAKAASYNIIRLQVQEVPGQGSILGLFYLKDKLYAARDYFTLQYTAPVSEPDYDDVLYIGPSYAGATWTGTLAKQITTSAAGDVVTGVMMFYNTTGTATLDTIKNHTQGDVDVATINSLTATAQAAGLYWASGDRETTGQRAWVHQELGGNVRYRDAQLEFTPANRLAPSTPQANLIQETDWKFATKRKAYGGGNSPPAIWAPAGVSTAPEHTDALETADGDTSYWHASLSATGGTWPFWVSDFGFTDSDIPAGSAITGFTVKVVRRIEKTLTPGGTVVDTELKLKFAPDSGVGDAIFGDGATPWGTTYGTVTYGGAQSLLGYTNVAAEDVKSEDFGFSFAAYLLGYVGPGSFDARVTQVEIKAHYIPPQSKVYFWNDGDPAPTAVLGEVVQSYQTSGTLGAIGVDNAKGNLYLMNVGTNRGVGTAEEIRTMPTNIATPPDGGSLDGSQLIATTETAMAKNVMDWGDLLRLRGSKYQYDTHNFYAAADFDAIYGVSGAGPAFMYDDYAFCRIYTGTPAEYELPRHVIVHQQRLFLGYKSGQYMWGEPGEPLQFEAAEGTSAEDGVGSAIRGFMTLNGDALAIFNQRGVNMIQGDVGLDPYPGVISPDVGCVEYSSQSMGNYMYMSFRGAQNLRATDAYGDFDSSQFSWDVWSWLSPRVQTSAFFESANIGLINSYPVRNKSQCRWCFADGAQLTATFLRAGEMPQFTIQKYTNAAGDPLTWDVVTAGVETNGRDRIFGATNDGTGYVYEIDRGYSFDGGNIDAYATLVVMDQQAPQQHKEYTNMQVHGKATDYASFTTSRSVNYGEVDPDKNYPNRFGSLTAAPTGVERYFSSAIPIRTVGRNLILRFDRDHNDQPPVTIQAVSYAIEPAGDKQT